jgi:hypothetical protein
MCRATEGDGLERLVRMAMPACQQAERRCPRQGPGRKPTIPDWVMLVLIMVATAKRRKSKSAQYRFLSAARNRLLAWMQIDCFPSRSTYFDRFRRAHALLRHVVEWEGRLAIQRGWADARSVAVDKRLPRVVLVGISAIAGAGIDLAAWMSKRVGPIRNIMVGCTATAMKSWFRPGNVGRFGRCWPRSNRPMSVRTRRFLKKLLACLRERDTC